ncbi:MAG: class I SAM-dependent methyltransferase [Neisseriaceae bacterium]
MFDFSSLYHRLIKNLKWLKKWAKHNQIEAFRLYDRDIPEFPFAMDLYRDNLYVQEYKTRWRMEENDYSLWLEGVRATIAQALQLEMSSIVLSLRQKQKGKNQYEKKNSRGKQYIVKENGLSFWIDLGTYIDVGLFLDHRPMRAYVGEHAANKRFLNLFCYTASFSVYAAAGGCSYSESVDLSNRYLEWAAKNYSLNHLDLGAHRLIKQDVFAYLEKAIEGKKQFDLIFLDPPSFSNSKGMRGILDIQRDQCWLIDQCMQLLSIKGLLIFSTNLRSFKLAEQLHNHYQITNQTKRSIPRDFRNQKIHQCWWITHQ